MNRPVCFDTPTINPALSSGEVDAIRSRVLAARDLLNHSLDEAALNGIQVDVRLIPIMSVGAARLGLKQHHLVEACPVLSPEEVERADRAQLASLKFRYENPLGSVLGSTATAGGTS